jgi:pimeloyl-ACP methyl ester carboxylesterase
VSCQQASGRWEEVWQQPNNQKRPPDLARRTPRSWLKAGPAHRRLQAQLYWAMPRHARLARAQSRSRRIPVLAHHRTPGSRHIYGRADADAAARGLRLISYDRPDYGKSARHPGRTVADCASDVRAICRRGRAGWRAAR